MGCFAVLLLCEMGVGDGLTAETMSSLPGVIFTCAQAWMGRPDSFASVVKPIAAGLCSAFALLTLSGGLLLSKSTLYMSWVASRSCSIPPPAGLVKSAARLRTIRTVCARRSIVSRRAAAHHLLLGFAVVVLALASMDSGAAAAKLRPWRQWPDLNGWAISKPSARLSQAMAATDDGNFWVFGGYSTMGESSLFKFDVPTKQWTAMTTSGPSPSARSGHAMAAVGDQLYLHGGFTFSGK